MNIDEKLKQNFKKLGLHIKKLRESQNISIRELSEKTGISKAYLNKIEKGTAYGVLIRRHLSNIAKALNISLCDLVDY